VGTQPKTTAPGRGIGGVDGASSKRKCRATSTRLLVLRRSRHAACPAVETPASSRERHCAVLADLLATTASAPPSAQDETRNSGEINRELLLRPEAEVVLGRAVRRCRPTAGFVRFLQPEAADPNRRTYRRAPRRGRRRAAPTSAGVTRPIALSAVVRAPNGSELAICCGPGARPGGRWCPTRAHGRSTGLRARPQCAQ